jgi:hypothetical protein
MGPGSGRPCRNRQPPLVLRFLREATETAVLRDTFSQSRGRTTIRARELLNP